MSELKKCYSLNDEDFNFDSMSDLIDSCDDPKVGGTYWEADCTPVTFDDALRINDLLENMDERIYEDVGEVYDNECSDVTDEAKAELRSLMEAWAEKHINLSHYWKIIGKSRECKFTQDDLNRV